jgi:hypothetical protein
MPITRTSGQGRPKGALNKRTVDVIDKLAALRCDPITGMARIAMDKKNAIELRAKMFIELAQYVAPKRKALEHSADGAMLEALLLKLDPQASWYRGGGYWLGGGVLGIWLAIVTTRASIRCTAARPWPLLLQLDAKPVVAGNLHHAGRLARAHMR